MVSLATTFLMQPKKLFVTEILGNMIPVGKTLKLTQTLEFIVWSDIL